MEKYCFSQAELFTEYNMLKGKIVFSNSILIIHIYYLHGFRISELKSQEWDILNHDRLIWLSNVHTFDFLLNPLFGYFYCIKVTFDNNYRYNAISIGLISDWIKVSCSLKPAFKALNKYKFNHVYMKLLKNLF